jgi:hypothetical protein
MFSEMISKEKILPRKLGIDRPSIKFLNFLQKYYGLKDYVPQNNNFVVFKDYFIDEPQKRDKYDIYNHNYNYNSTKKDNYNYNYNSNSKNNILTQRKLGKFNQINNNENISYNNSKNYEEPNQKEKDKDFTTRIYREYYNKPNEEVYQKENEQKKEKEDENEYHYKLKQKKSFGYNQYQSSSSEYGAIFHMNK